MATNIVGGERRFPDIVAANYTDLSTNFPAALYTNQYAEVINSQGTSWLPGSLGGTYYSKGFYKSNGTTWEYIGSFPYQATQAQVDAGTNNDRFVTPLTLKNSTQWDTKLDVSAIPSNLILYATSAASDVVGYFRLVTDISDPDYDSPAIDVPTGPITGTGQLVATLISDAGLINGNPGIISIITTGNIRRTTNNGSGDFYYEVYHRDSGGTETLIATSSNTANVVNMTYEQFYAPALLNNGSFGATDRLVIKYYGNKTSSTTPEYEFQFGGSQPVRTLLPIPLTATFSGGGASIQWIEKDTNYNVNNYEGILANTISGSFTVTLPASPSLGDTVGITDAKGNFGINSLFVARNGSLIQGAANDLEIDVKDASFLLIYTGATTGWKLDTYLDKVVDPVNYVPETRTINGLDLTANRTLTTADINDSTNRRYVTDAEKTVIGNTSGTNTGDETKNSILTKLGWYSHQINTASGLVTTTSPTIVGNIPIPANTYNSSGGKFEFNMFCIKTSAVGTITIEAWLGQTSNNLAGATRIATTGAITLNARYAPFRRKTNFDGTNIVGLSFSSGNQNDDSSNSTTHGSLAFDRTIDNYLMFVITLGSASDNAYLQFAEFKNF